MRKLLAASLLVTSVALFAGGCDMGARDQHTNMWASVKTAVAVLQPTDGNSSVKGWVEFQQMDDHVHVTGEVSGLAPNSVHAFHIHEFGDQTSKDGMAAGGHYNPEGHPHGNPDAGPHHAGDMGNITADASGTAKIDMMLHSISIAGMMDPIIGRGVVVHAKPDDFGQPVGNAGGRIAVGVIGIKKNP